VYGSTGISKSSDLTLLRVAFLAEFSGSRGIKTKRSAFGTTKMECLALTRSEETENSILSELHKLFLLTEIGKSNTFFFNSATSSPLTLRRL
jgi:hypothetical protein